MFWRNGAPPLQDTSRDSMKLFNAWMKHFLCRVFLSFLSCVCPCRELQAHAPSSQRPGASYLRCRLKHNRSSSRCDAEQGRERPRGCRVLLEQTPGHLTHHVVRRSLLTAAHRERHDTTAVRRCGEKLTPGSIQKPDTLLLCCVLI